VAMAVGFCGLGAAQELKDIQLPKPRMEGGKPLMQALKERSTSREYSDQKLSEQTLSDLLWAACGVNRPESGKRTAPSARNWQEIDIYVTMETGVYLYDAVQNVLKAVLAEDLRAATGTQPFVKTAPVNLVFVADYAKIKSGEDTDKTTYSNIDTGFISQNVYLFCASEGLGTVVRGLVDRKTLAEKMKLRPDQKVVLAQSVGYPKKK
jgi:SagB-type dehydrogenase family enzyme